MNRIMKQSKEMEDFSLDNLPLTNEEIKKAVVNNCMVSVEELQDLVKTMLLSRPQANEAILELGTYQGRTCGILCAALKESRLNNTIVAVDCFVHGEKLIDSWLNINRDNNAMLVVSNTRKFLANYHEPTAFIFVDAGHDYDNAYHDIYWSMPLVKQGGFLFIDDYNGWSYPGVFQAVNELLKDNPAFKQHIFSNVYVAYEKL